jgi:hypothetical protein
MNITVTINKETKYISSDNTVILYQLELQEIAPLPAKGNTS